MPSADIVLKNARVITFDPAQPIARSIAISGDRISYIGKEEIPEGFVGPGTRVIDCRGKTVLPGFNDAHCHIFSFMRKLLSIDLSAPTITCIDDIKLAIKRKADATPRGKWVLATDYSEFYLAEKRHPTRRDLDEVAPYHPVVLSHRSLHGCVLNSLALSLAGITRETPEPPGAMIDREVETGEPSGVLFEMLGYIRDKVMPHPSESELIKGMALVNQSYLSEGLTSVQDATVTNNLSRWEIYRRFKESGRLKSRLRIMPGINTFNQFREAGLNFRAGDNGLRVGGVKLLLGEATGRLYPSQPDLNDFVLKVSQAGFQVSIHAVQQSTVEAAAKAMEYVREKLPNARLRHRIEHCAECPPNIPERLATLGAVVATQPPFLYYSGDRYLSLVPAERQPWLYRFRSLMGSGVTVAASSDSPIVSHNPLAGVYAAVTRKTRSGRAILPEESISPTEALAMYTTNAAYAAFEEDVKGSITPGRLADLVVLSGDPTAVEPEELPGIKVEMTMVGGEVVWKA